MLKKLGEFLRFLESWKLEAFLILVAIGSYGISFVNPLGSSIGLHYSFRILLFVYLIRIFISFRLWRLSRGVAIINAFLSFQISSAFMAIGFTALKYPGYELLIRGAISGLQIFLIIMGIFFLVRWRKLNKQVYWKNLRWNLARVFIATLICFLLFYVWDIPTELSIQPISPNIS